MSYDVYWVKNRAEKITDFEHPTLRGALFVNAYTLPITPINSPLTPHNSH